MAQLQLSAMVVSGLSALVGGALGALLTVSILRNEASPHDARPRPEPLAENTPAVAKAPLDGRVAALERSLQALALKESMARSVAQPPSSADADERTTADVAPIVDNPVFEAAVRDVMDRAEQERNLERESQRAEWRKRTAEEWGAELGEKLRLTEIQKAKVIEVANTFWEKLRDLRQGDAGPPPSREQWRERVDTLRKSAEAELGKVLDASQLTSYRELDEASRLGSPRSLRASQRAGRRTE